MSPVHRPLAPHVQAAVQRKPQVTAVRPAAPHVQAAVQLKTQAAPVARTVAPHIHATVQRKSPPAPGRAPAAPHVQAALRLQGGEARRPAGSAPARPISRSAQCRSIAPVKVPGATAPPQAIQRATNISIEMGSTESTLGPFNERSVRALASKLDELAGNGNWAFTGGWALYLWCRHGGKECRQPNDLDVLVTPEAYDAASLGLQGFLGLDVKTQGSKHRMLKGGELIKVDILMAGTGYGALDTVGTVDGFPVIPVKGLIAQQKIKLANEDLGLEDRQKTRQDITYAESTLPKKKDCCVVQ